MAFVDLPTATDHLRADADDPRVPPLLAAAEQFAINRLDRNVYADAPALTAAIAAAPAALATAKTAYDAAIDAADALTDCELADAARRYADGVWLAARCQSDRAQGGVVINDSIKAAVLLQLEHLFDGADTEKAAAALLQPYVRY